MQAPTRRWIAPLAAGLVVLAAQLWLVAGAGTDVPFFDQWDAEGRALYPAAVEGRVSAGLLLAPHNEHRILWTRLADLALFQLNGQWDPLVQLALNAGLHAGVAALLAALLARGFATGAAAALAAGVAGLNLPAPGWHNALWGFQSQVYFCSGFALAALAVWSAPALSPRRLAAGAALAVAAMLAMGGGLLVPAAAGAAWLIQGGRRARDWAVLAALGALAVALQAGVPAHAALRAPTVADFLVAFRRLLAWPDRTEPWMALVLNLPLLACVVARARGRLAAAAGEPFVVALAAWGLLVAAATAWSRGGGGEFLAGVPSRYADFCLLLPLVNLWCVARLLPAASGLWRLPAGLWVALLALAWAAAAQQEWRGVLGPRRQDRDAPARLARQFQLTRDPAVFAGQPRLYLAHPEPVVVAAVLGDDRLAGRLPPTFQPEQRPGPLSRAVRALLGR